MQGERLTAAFGAFFFMKSVGPLGFSPSSSWSSSGAENAKEINEATQHWCEPTCPCFEPLFDLEPDNHWPGSWDKDFFLVKWMFSGELWSSDKTDRWQHIWAHCALARKIIVSQLHHMRKKLCHVSLTRFCDWFIRLNYIAFSRPYLDNCECWPSAQSSMWWPDRLPEWQTSLQ